MTDRPTPAKLRRMADQLDAGAGHASAAADLPQFGNDDREPFWEGARLLGQCADRLRRLADDVEHAARKAPQ